MFRKLVHALKAETNCLVTCHDGFLAGPCLFTMHHHTIWRYTTSVFVITPLQFLQTKWSKLCKTLTSVTNSTHSKIPLQIVRSQIISNDLLNHKDHYYVHRSPFPLKMGPIPSHMNPIVHALFHYVHSDAPEVHEDILGSTPKHLTSIKTKLWNFWTLNQLWSSHSVRFFHELRCWHAKNKLNNLVNRWEPHK
jgi:hypothetical protein